MLGIWINNTYYNLDLLLKAEFVAPKEAGSVPALLLDFAVSVPSPPSIVEPVLYREYLQGNAAVELRKFLEQHAARATRITA